MTADVRRLPAASALCPQLSCFICLTTLCGGWGGTGGESDGRRWRGEEERGEERKGEGRDEWKDEWREEVEL